MIIKNSTLDDIPIIFQLYDQATELQRKLFPSNAWPSFDENLIRTEIQELRQWKLLIDNQIACIWATTFSDPMIWEDKNIDPAVYIHRIATNPDFRGRQFVKTIIEWAKSHAINHGKKFIRMDTCGENKKLIDYYSKSGFDFLGINKLKSAEGLPMHYQGADVCFFEIELSQ